MLPDYRKARLTIDLCDLDSVRNNLRATDLRWKYRFEAYLLAKDTREHWNNWGCHKESEFIVLLTELAKAKGFFSIGFHGFQDVPVIKEALINGFTGTDKLSFAGTTGFDPVMRAKGDL